MPKLQQFIGYRQQKVKGKANPVQGWACPEGSRRLSLSDFMTVGT
jgi:hypothetical protein